LKIAELGIAFDFSKVKSLVQLNPSIIDYVNTYYELRKKKKKCDLGMAKDLMEDGSFLEL
jgi:phosphate acetyltransferase